MPRGRVFTECPISTADGVKAADVAWASSKRVRELGKRTCFPRAPEICVEVISESNTDAEIEEKAALYLNAGAQEVWICELDGVMRFLDGGGAHALEKSRVCPGFPKRLAVPRL
jgi:Uma2 family endonuclease